MYDSVMHHVPYAAWARYLLSSARSYFGTIPGSVLDLACGTGTLLIYLSRRVKTIRGMDRSRPMLARAKDRLPGGIYRVGRLEGPIPYTSESQQWIVSTHDSLNYLTAVRDLERHFREVHRILVPGGLYSFDLVSLSNILSHFHHQTFVRKAGDLRLVWSNVYDKKTRIVTSDLNFYRGRVLEKTETHLQRYYDPREALALAAKAGLTCIRQEGDYESREVEKEDTMLNFHVVKTA